MPGGRLGGVEGLGQLEQPCFVKRSAVARGTSGSAMRWAWVASAGWAMVASRADGLRRAQGGVMCHSTADEL